MSYARFISLFVALALFTLGVQSPPADAASSVSAIASGAPSGHPLIIEITCPCGVAEATQIGHAVNIECVEYTPTPTATSIVPTPTTTPTTTVARGVPAQVVNIVDGDTIDVFIMLPAPGSSEGVKVRVRYILINTPERGRPYFNEATAANRALVSGQTIYLVKDVNETDRYGRLLRYVYLADGTFVNEELVRQGYAKIATYPPDVAMEAVIRAAQDEARAAGRGIWAAAPEISPTPRPVPLPELVPVPN